MSNKKTLKLFIALLVSLSCNSLVWSQTKLISADNPLFNYTGRIDFSMPNSPLLSWPGSSIETVFTGTELTIHLDDQLGLNYFNIFIDNDWENPIIIECIKGRKSYFITDELASGTHTLAIFKRTEGKEGATLFNGLSLSASGKILPSSKKLTRKIEFIGDSVTSGLGNEAPLTANDKIRAEKNNYFAYGAITARALNAQYHSTSHSGIGIMVSWFDYTMPEYFTQLNAVGKNNSKWDFNQWQPNVVVINLFQNDSWLVESRLTPTPTDQERVMAYHNFLIQVRGAYPHAYIIATLGSMDAVKAGSKWPGYIKKAVDNIKKQTNDHAITTLFFDYTGYDKHPRIIQHRANANKLTIFIKNKLNW